MSSSAPIGVFDSGLGGISVAREIAKDMPAEHVLYFQRPVRRQDPGASEGLKF